jgi:UDP-glucose 4-epimerase
MDKILKRTSKVFTDGNQKREWVHVDDVAEANYLASKSSQNSIYNVGSGDCISFNDLVDLIRLDCFEYVDCPFSKTYQNYTKSNIDKIKKELGYNTKRTLESNLLNLEIKLRSHFNV